MDYITPPSEVIFASPMRSGFPNSVIEALWKAKPAQVGATNVLDLEMANLSLPGTQSVFAPQYPYNPLTDSPPPNATYADPTGERWAGSGLGTVLLLILGGLLLMQSQPSSPHTRYG